MNIFMRARYLWKALTLSGILAICYFLATGVAGHWFEKRLRQNGPVESGISVTQPRKRLCLIFALDGVPYDIIKELYMEGYFKGFFPPGRLVSTFPSLTRPAFSKMLVGGKPFGYERLYYNVAENKVEGFQLAKKLFSTNKQYADYQPELHFFGFPGYIAYVFPNTFAQAALDAFYEQLLTFKGDRFVAYLGLTDPIAHVEGKEALKAFLKKISAMLDKTRNDLGILMDVVLFSDHSNNLIENQRVDIGAELEKNGYRDVDLLEQPQDFVLPRNGFVSFATVYTRPENAQSMAEILSMVAGVDFTTYKYQDVIRVHGVNGLAEITRRKGKYRYAPIQGDPLKLGNILMYLKQAGKMDNQGFIHDEMWWDATQDHLYPDPLRRIWEGQNDLVQHPGTLLVSFAEGYAFGPIIFNQPFLNNREGTHGALLATHSNGVFMTDFMKVDDFNQPSDLVKLLAESQETKERGTKLFPFIK